MKRFFIVLFVAALAGGAIFLSREVGSGTLSFNSSAPLAWIGQLFSRSPSLDGRDAGRVAREEVMSATTAVVTKTATDAAAPVTKKSAATFDVATEVQESAREGMFAQAEKAEQALSNVSARLNSSFDQLASAAREALFGVPPPAESNSAAQAAADINKLVCPDGTVIYRNNSSCAFIVCPPSR